MQVSRPRVGPLGGPFTRGLGAAVLLAPALLLLGCGDRPPGGRGLLHPATATGAAGHLVVEGTPYEMGWWQGHLLREPIARLHAAWLSVLLAATAGDADGAAAAALSERLDLYVDQTRHRLPERLLQELEGLSAGCGLPADELLRTEVMRDALRMEGMSARLPGALAVARTAQGLEARAWWAGPELGLLAAHWLLIERRPTQGGASLSLAWPGSLGGLAVVRPDGRAGLSMEIEIPERARQGFGSGWPFSVALRVSVEEAASLAEQLTRSRGTVGHGLLALDEPRARGVVVQGREQGEAVTDVEVNVGFDTPRALNGRDLLALGPYPDPQHPLAQQLDSESRDESELASVTRAERLASVRRHASGRPDQAQSSGPQLSIRFAAGKALVTFLAAGDGGARTVGLAGP